MSRQDKVRSQT